MLDFPTKPQIYFVRSSADAVKMNAGVIVICAPQDNWNDFGYQTSFDLSIVVAPGQVIWRRFRLAFLEPVGVIESEYEVVRDVFKNRPQEVLSADNFPQFFTMQSSPQAYRELVSELGQTTTKNILIALNDIVLAERSQPAPSWLDSAIKSEAFNVSFLRAPEGFLAYFEGYNVFSGRVAEFEENPPEYLKFAFQLDAFVNPHVFEFSFSTIGVLPKNMAVIIGKNGVGKSRTLNELTHAILEAKPNLVGKDGGPPLISKLIAVCTPGETELTFPPARDNNSRVQYVRLSAIPGKKMGGDNEPLPLILQKLARQDVAQNSYRWDIFKHSVEKLIPFDELGIIPSVPPTDRQQISPQEYSVGNVRLIDLNKGNEKLRLDAARRLDRNGALARTVNGKNHPLSSGQLSFVRLAAQLCLHVSPATLVLIDEPETHLHPHMITQFVVMLNEILKITNSIAIIATHSAYLVREIPTTQVHVITQDNYNGIDIGYPRLKTFGADVGAISSFIFEDRSINKLIDDVALGIKEDGELSKNWEEILGGDLSTEAIMFLKRSQKNRDIKQK